MIRHRDTHRPSLSPLHQPVALGIAVGLILAALLIPAVLQGCSSHRRGRVEWEIGTEAQTEPPSSGSASPRREESDGPPGTTPARRSAPDPDAE